MMQRGRIVILGNAGKNLGDSMYDGTIYLGGEARSLGVDAVPGRDDRRRPRMAVAKAEDVRPVPETRSSSHVQKIVAGKQLWNYDNLEPSEKKLVL